MPMAATADELSFNRSAIEIKTSVQLFLLRNLLFFGTGSSS